MADRRFAIRRPGFNLRDWIVHQDVGGDRNRSPFGRVRIASAITNRFRFKCRLERIPFR